MLDRSPKQVKATLFPANRLRAGRSEGAVKEQLGTRTRGSKALGLGFGGLRSGWQWSGVWTSGYIWRSLMRRRGRGAPTTAPFKRRVSSFAVQAPLHRMRRSGHFRYTFGGV